MINASVTELNELTEVTFALFEHLHLAFTSQLLEQSGLSRLREAAQLQT